jgi:hypothetical protein
MKHSPTLLIFAAVVLFVSVPAYADDAAVAKQLEAIGGKVMLKDGVVSQVNFTDCSKIGDAELRAIGQLSHLKTLVLYGGCKGLNDETAPHLASLKELEVLGTEGAELTDAGLKPLAALSSVRQISFFHLSLKTAGFTGAGFEHLKACPKLERLTVAGIKVRDEAFAAISTISQLREFSTWHTWQTEDANALLAKLPNLAKLKLGQRMPNPHSKAPSLSDASIPTLVTMKSLESLNIGEARFTLGGLSQLKGLPKLKMLTLWVTDFPESDVEKLRAVLPGVKIEYQPMTADQQKKFDQYLK